MLLRSLLFYIFLGLWTIFLGIICLPSFLFKRDYLKILAKIWIKGIFLILKLTCNITYEIQGIHNLPNKPVIIASKHQSAFETFALYLHIKNSVFIHKKQLFYIPIFGQYLKRINMISIDRSEGTKSIKKILFEAKKNILLGNSIIIFPEGTRKKPGEPTKYKSGIYAIYKEASSEIVPIALNSGNFWPKHTFIKKPGKIIIKILEKIPMNLEKFELLNKIESEIESETKKII